MDITLKRKRTSPPQHFTEGTLINAMKNIHRFVDDKAARATLRETSGLGTEATRAGILEVLKRRGYIEKRGKKLFSTEKGQSIIDLCPNSMKDIVTTAVLEDVLSDVQQGSRTAKEAVAIYSDKLAPMIQEVFSQDVSHIPCPQFEPCPLCHKALKRIKGRKSGNYFWVCCNQDCHGLFTDDNGKPGKHIVPAEVSTTYTCPECGKALVKRMRKDQSGTFWSCSGYPQCRWTASDDNGKPGLAKKTEKPPVSGPFFCPLCGQQLRYSRSRTGTPYWACFPKDHKKHTAVAFFSCDTNGAPILPKSNSRSAS
ncbi:MAG: topoisomerase DNA-binding C4 zinc finger domain-containing protein, partial [Desulfovibrio sp.]|nr:topoisomerase DNA-binding C4 zinc finger domain-containing protein [Desulfovibrio sp.]